MLSYLTQLTATSNHKYSDYNRQVCLYAQTQTPYP